MTEGNQRGRIGQIEYSQWAETADNPEGQGQAKLYVEGQMGADITELAIQPIKGEPWA